MSGSSLQFVLENTTTIENLSRKTKVWQLAVLLPREPAHSYNPPPYRTITYGQDPNNTRTFAILHSKPGENPWDLGYLRNFKSVMGEHWYDWILPIKPSPCANHDRRDYEFETGPAVERMKSEVGISNHTAFDEEKPRRHRRRRRRHSTHAPPADRMAGNKETRREEGRRKGLGDDPLPNESRRDSGVDR
ncbi:MAG: hypothetical protein Q9226_001213 [Calogaya cf. arnoldii]